MNTKAVNIKEFWELIDRYESITLKEIKKEPIIDYFAKKLLTGFGNLNTCTLCHVCRLNCFFCVYGYINACSDKSFEESYDEIYDAETPKGLLKAYRNRAKVMKNQAALHGITRPD